MAALPVLTRQPSSPSVTSRTWKTPFSIIQWRGVSASGARVVGQFRDCGAGVPACIAAETATPQ
jgi:hypothetical protein